jgi:anti-sigma factor RsiW
MSESDRFLDRLNDYLEGSLDHGERRQMESHLASCQDCRRALEELREITRLARELPAPEPPERIWSSISASLRERSGTGPAAAEPATGRYLHAGLLLAATLLIGIGLWLATRPEAPPPPDSRALADRVTEEIRAAEAHYENAIGGLEQIMAANDGVLSPELAGVLNQNLDLIERAITESRNAIESEPESTAAQQSLLEALRLKVSLLQNTILLINEVRKGEGENARDLIDGMRKKATPSNPI